MQYESECSSSSSPWALLSADPDLQFIRLFIHASLRLSSIRQLCGPLVHPAARPSSRSFYRLSPVPPLVLPSTRPPRRSSVQPLVRPPLLIQPTVHPLIPTGFHQPFAIVFNHSSTAPSPVVSMGPGAWCAIGSELSLRCHGNGHWVFEIRV